MVQLTPGVDTDHFENHCFRLSIAYQKLLRNMFLSSCLSFNDWQKNPVYFDLFDIYIGNLKVTVIT